MANTKKITVEEINVETDKNVEIAESVKEEKEASKSIADINASVDFVAGSSAAEKTPLRKTDIDFNKEISVRSVTFGGLNWKSSKTGAYYRWNEIGAVEFIPFYELVTMMNTTPVFLREPYVVLLDEEAVNYFRLAPVYKKLAVVNNLESLFKEGDIAKVEKALMDIRNTGMRKVAVSKIKELRESHTLNNIDIIRLIERILFFDLE